AMPTPWARGSNRRWIRTTPLQIPPHAPTMASTMVTHPPSPQTWPASVVERHPVSTLIPYARNARTHSQAQVAKIAASIREWGWTSPILIDESGTILAGHGRVLAAQFLGLEEVPCVVARGPNSEADGRDRRQPAGAQRGPVTKKSWPPPICSSHLRIVYLRSPNFMTRNQSAVEQPMHRISTAQTISFAVLA